MRLSVASSPSSVADSHERMTRLILFCWETLRMVGQDLEQVEGLLVY